MRKQETISIFRDPLDPRELNFGLSQPHVDSESPNETGIAPHDFKPDSSGIVCKRCGQRYPVCCQIQRKMVDDSGDFKSRERNA